MTTQDEPPAWLFPGGALCLVIVVVAISVSGCPPTPPSEQVEHRGAQNANQTEEGARNVVAVVNGEEFTQSEIEDRIDALPDYARARFRTVEKRREYLTSLVHFEILADVAEGRELGSEPVVRDAIKNELERQRLQEAARSELTMEDIPDDAVEEAYRERIDEFRTPEYRRAVVIITESEKRAKFLRKKLAKPTLDTPKARLKLFRRIASQECSDAVVARRGGKLADVKPPDLEDEYPEIAEVLYQQDERGTVSEVFQLDDRWYIATWSKRWPPKKQQLEAVAREIRTELYEKRKKAIKRKIRTRWRKDASVEIEDSLGSRLDKPPTQRRTRKEQIPLVSTDEIDSANQTKN